MQQQTQILPRLRCFPHYVGNLPTMSTPGKGSLVDSCVVDVTVNGHLVYAYIDPITAGQATHPLGHGSTVSVTTD